ncbi:MAG: hypothetical protein AAB675_02675 [Patescibacteria group bacterium]
MSAENPQEGRRISRRSFNGSMLKATAALGVLAVFGSRPSFDRQDNDPVSESISSFTRERLMQFSFQTVAHNGGDSIPIYEEYKKTGCSRIEADVYKFGNSVRVGHRKFIGVPDIIRDSSQAKEADRDFEEVLQQFSDDGINMLIDFKDIPSVVPTLDTIERSGGLGLTYFTSQAWDALAQVASRQNGDYSNLFYTIQSEELVKRFFDYKYYPRGSFGVALDKDVASTGNIHRFKDVGATVFVYTVARASHALALLEDGVDGLITNNKTLLSISTDRV